MSQVAQVRSPDLPQVHARIHGSEPDAEIQHPPETGYVIGILPIRQAHQGQGTGFLRNQLGAGRASSE
ncbi:hypothetical protein DEDE109153_11395 [Deinococcus deserti]|nr:hypothetical protein [Deinococcus deserti]